MHPPGSGTMARVLCVGPMGCPTSTALRAAVGRLGSRDAFLYAFDLLEIDGTARSALRVKSVTLVACAARDAALTDQAGRSGHQTVRASGR
jgi:hypothetical protein